MQSLRAGLILLLFLAFTLPLMPFQLGLIGLNAGWARRFPHWYHSHVCRLFGVSVHIEGEVCGDHPVLFVSNHVSWLDIPVLSAVAPVSFVAKHEIGGWPFVGWLAKLQRSIFVDRERRGATVGTAREILRRLHDGDNMVLFAEGTTSDGNGVLPFRTALFAAAKPSGPEAERLKEGIVVQTLAIAYTRLYGLPLQRRERPLIAWYGDMLMAGHAWELLRRGPMDVHIRLGEPVALSDFADRKSLARYAEARVRRDVAELLSPRHRTPRGPWPVP